MEFEENGAAFGKIDATEISIIRGCARMKKFNFFQWLWNFKNSTRNLRIENLSRQDDWEKVYGYPSEVMNTTKATCTGIADEIGMIIFFHDIVKKDLEISLLLFRELQADMTKLERFYAQMRTRLAQATADLLQKTCWNQVEKHFSKFSEKTFSNVATVNADLDKLHRIRSVDQIILSLKNKTEIFVQKI